MLVDYGCPGVLAKRQRAGAAHAGREACAVKLAFVGGTGPEGLGLAMRFALAGHSVAVGSRQKDRGEEGAAKVLQAVPNARATGGENAVVVQDADVVFLTFPYAGQKETLVALAPLLAGKTICDVVAPLEFVKGVGAVGLNVPGNSAAEEAAALLPGARVVSAFQNMAADELQRLDHPLDADALVCGDDTTARATVLGLAGEIAGVRGVDGGPLSNSRYVELLTALLVNLNRHHKTRTAIRITGLPAGG